MATLFFVPYIASLIKRFDILTSPFRQFFFFCFIVAICSSCEEIFPPPAPDSLCFSAPPPSFTVSGPATDIDLTQIDSCGFTCTKRKVTLNSNFEDIVLYSPMLGQSIWLGSILSAKSLTAGVPDPVIVDRKPLNVSVLGLSLQDNARDVESPNAASVDAGVNDILRDNLGNQWTPAILSVEYIETHTQAQVGLQGGLKGLFDIFSGGFDFSSQTEKHSVFFKVVQRYYTANIQASDDPTDYLADDVSCERLYRDLDPDDVPVLISSVVYGRILVYQMIQEKGVSTEQMKASFTAKILGTGTYTDELKQVWESSEKRILVLGGDPNAAVKLLQNEDAGSFFEEGLRWSKDSPGVPLIYKANLLNNGLEPFSYGETTDFTIMECDLVAGDNLWNIYSFGCDRGHDNNFVLKRDGTPVCGSGNCPGAPSSCWQNQQKLGGNTGAGSLDINFDKDMQVYGETWLFVENNTHLSDVPFSADVGRVWLNEVDITANPLQISLSKGWNHIEFTCYNQNNRARIAIPYALADLVQIMDSDGCN